MKLFEYVILHRQPERTDAQGNVTPERLTVVQDLKRTVAKDDRTALLAAAREIPAEYSDKLDRVEIAIRPF